jgi:hypothetical protein
MEEEKYSDAFGPTPLDVLMLNSILSDCVTQQPSVQRRLRELFDRTVGESKIELHETKDDN